MKPVSNVIFFPCRDILETKRYYAEVLELPVYSFFLSDPNGYLLEYQKTLD